MDRIESNRGSSESIHKFAVLFVELTLFVSGFVVPGFIVMALEYHLFPIWTFRIEQGPGAAAVGLVALAGHRLATNIAYDHIAKVLLLISAGACYTAPWLYPAIMAFGGSASFVYDTIVERSTELTQTGISQSNTTKNAERLTS
ncbi:hypothetical protein BC937DRAFT_87248 [Endogone sp. FLAS-F59071]|nr:hypothetical protein BC937DRAFT_87248 [Endogone sp. FLAS-F59071]|eukprot:RUS22751.1 hypothetical protein BC937DRAFT_87248 [Endogone sp. FLAS-F59071]